MIAGKRGTIVENMSEIGIALVIILVAFILMAFAANINKAGKLDKSQNEMNRAIIENTIALYLKTPVEVQGFENQELTMTDLIVLFAENPNSDYKETWKRDSESFFNQVNLGSGPILFMIRIYLGDATDEVVFASFSSSGSAGIRAAYHRGISGDLYIYLPGHSQRIKVEVGYASV